MQPRPFFTATLKGLLKKVPAAVALLGPFSLVTTFSAALIDQKILTDLFSLRFVRHINQSSKACQK